MIATIMWIAVMLSLIGAFYTARDNAKDRAIGFTIWIISNTTFVICHWGNEWAMVCQFGMFTIFSIIGLYNNLKDK